MTYDRADSSSNSQVEQLAVDPAATATPSPGKLLKRGEAARLLGVSTATVRRMEGSTLTPVLGPDGIHRFREEHVRELVIHRVRTMPESPDAYDAEEAATAFELFDQDVHQVDVVKRMKLHPRAVAAIHREWVSMRGGYAVTGEIARQLAALPWLLGSRPICSGEDLLKCLRQTAPHVCSRCEQSSPELCAQCAKDLTVEEADRKVVAARRRQEAILQDGDLTEWSAWQLAAIRQKQRKGRPESQGGK
jgi:hypothetical protein